MHTIKRIQHKIMALQNSGYIIDAVRDQYNTIKAVVVTEPETDSGDIYTLNFKNFTKVVEYYLNQGVLTEL